MRFFRAAIKIEGCPCQIYRQYLNSSSILLPPCLPEVRWQNRASACLREFHFSPLLNFNERGGIGAGLSPRANTKYEYLYECTSTPDTRHQASDTSTQCPVHQQQYLRRERERTSSRPGRECGVGMRITLFFLQTSCEAAILLNLLCSYGRPPQIQQQ